MRYLPAQLSGLGLGPQGTRGQMATLPSEERLPSPLGTRAPAQEGKWAVGDQLWLRNGRRPEPRHLVWPTPPCLPPPHTLVGGEHPPSFGA